MSDYVICIDNESNPASLIVGKVYRRLPDVDAERDGMVRVIDEDISEPDGYLYPSSMFVPIELPESAERALMAIGTMLRFVIICLFLLMPSSAESATVDRADIDINGVVDIHDFIAFAGSFGKHVLSPLPSYILWSDLDGNGRVDFADFLEFIPWFGHKLSRAEMGITLTSFPDTVRIGKPESLDVLIEQNKIRCDVVTLSLDLLDHPDSIAVSAIPVDDYGSHLNASRVTVAANGNLGNHRLVVGISYCLRAVRDTFHFVVIPVADPFIGK